MSINAISGAQPRSYVSAPLQFAQGGRGKPVTMAGKAAKRHEATAALAAQEKKVPKSFDEYPLRSASYHFAPADLKAAVHNDLGHLAFDALAETSNLRGMPYYNGGTATVTPIKGAQVNAAMTEIYGDQLADAGALERVTNSFIHGPPLVFYRAHWDNRDDTSLDGVIAVNTKTGTMRALARWEVP